MLWPGSGLVFHGIPDPAEETVEFPPNSTGLVNRDDVAGTVALARRLRPSARRILVISCVSPLDSELERRARHAITSLNWGSYPILTFPNVPDVAIDLIDRPTEVPWGAGEPTTSVVPSAIANAVYDVTVARLRSVPFRPPSVPAALASAPRS